MPSVIKPLSVVFDTNVLVSAFSRGGVPARALQIATSSQCELYLSSFILEELSRVLILKIHHSRHLVNTFISELQEQATVIQPKEILTVVKEKTSDNRILEAALAADAVFPVSGDKRHILSLRKIGPTQIVTPRIFIKAIEEL